MSRAEKLMLKSEMIGVLGLISAVDNRVVDRVMIEVWYDMLGHMTKDEALAALREFRLTQPGVYLEPGHLWQIAKVQRTINPPPNRKIYAVDVIESDQEIE